MAFFLIVPSVMIVSVLLTRALANRLGLRIYHTTLAAVAIMAFPVTFGATRLSPAIGREYFFWLGALIVAASGVLTLANKFLHSKELEEERRFTEEVKAAYEAEKRKSIAVIEDKLEDVPAPKTFAYNESSAESEVNEPFAESEVNEPSAESELNEPSAESELNEPSAESELNEPSAESELNEPSAESELNEPSAESEVNEPSAESEVDEPSAESELNKSSAESEVNEPSAESEVNEPPAESEVDEPSAESEVNEPSAESEVNEPPAESEVDEPSEEVKAEVAAELSEAPALPENFPLEKIFKPLPEPKPESVEEPITLSKKPKPVKIFPLEKVFEPLTELKHEEIVLPPEKKSEPEKNFPLQKVFEPLSTVNLDKLEKITQEEKKLPHKEDTKPEERIDTLDDLLDKAYEERDKGHTWQAIATSKKALERYQGDEYAPFVAIDLCNIYKEQALYTEAIKVYEQALALPAIKRNDSARKEFQNNLRYLRLLREVLLKHRALSTPFSQLPKDILQEVDIEFKKVQYQ